MDAKLCLHEIQEEQTFDVSHATITQQAALESPMYHLYIVLYVSMSEAKRLTFKRRHIETLIYLTLSRTCDQVRICTFPLLRVLAQPYLQLIIAFYIAVSLALL